MLISILIYFILGIVLEKFFLYGFIILIFTFLGFLINFYYGGLLFSGELYLNYVLKKAGFVYLLLLFNLSLALCTSAFFKKGVGAGFAALICSYTLNTLSYVGNLKDYVPSGLLSSSNSALFSVSIAIALFVFIAIIRLNKRFLR